MDADLNLFQAHDKPSSEALVASYKRRDRLHRATGMVLLAFTIYILFFWVFGTLILWGILSLYPAHPEMTERGFSSLWVASFLTATSFHNVGLTLQTDSLISYIHQPGVYLWVGVLAIAGCTGLPILMRCLLQSMLSLSLYFPSIFDSDAVKLALDTPRLITYNVFDSDQTRILVWSFFVINVAEFVTFYGSCSLTEISPFTDLDTATRIGVSVAKTTTIRNAGLEFVDARKLSTGMHVVYMISMWLSTAPFVSRMYVSEMVIDHVGEVHYTDKLGADSAWSRFSTNFLFRHTFVILLAIICLGFVENDMIHSHPVVNFFDIQFEVVSAYGNVGLSMGYPGSMASLCGAMSSIGKIILIIVMVVGKLRGLPTHSDTVTDFSFKELKYWARKAKKESKAAKGSREVSRVASREAEGSCEAYRPCSFEQFLPLGHFEDFEKERLQSGRLKKGLKNLHTRDVDQRLDSIQSLLQVVASPPLNFHYFFS